jgi:TolB protein
MPLRLLALATVAAIALLAGCDTVGPPTPLAVEPEDRYPAWSPDGARIAYFHEEKHADAADADPSYATGLYVLDLTTGARRLVAEGYAITPDWSPDGEWLAVSAGDIAVVRPDGSGFRYLTDHGSAFFPRYSPDGAALSYGRSGTQEEVGLWFVRLADSTQTRFGFGASPADWAPDGRRIVYGGPPGEAEGGGQVWAADTSGTARSQLSRNGFVDNDYAAWSPDGRWIAWTALKEGGTAALWLMRADGAEPRELLTDAQEPAWAPDSERIVFSRGREGRDRLTLWSVARDGSDLQQLTF